MTRPVRASRSLAAGGALLLAATALGTAVGVGVDRLLSDPVQPAAPAPRAGPLPVPAATRVGPPVDVLDPGDRLRVDGIGPVRVGATLAQARAAAGRPLQTSGDGRCTRAVPTGGPDVVLVAVGGRVVRVDVTGDSPVRTLSGAGLGDETAALRARFGARLVEDGDRLRLRAERGGYALDLAVADGRVTAMRAGLVRALEPGYCS